MSVPDSWTIAQGWVIREIGTEKYIPQPVNSRSLSHYEPSATGQFYPKVFRTERSAKNFLAQWQRGEMYAYEDSEIRVRKVASRDLSKLEIIPLKLVIEPAHLRDK